MDSVVWHSEHELRKTRWNTNETFRGCNGLFRLVECMLLERFTGKKREPTMNGIARPSRTQGILCRQ